jgi:hypothetical protein
MLYFDYDWDLSPLGILLDRELDTDKLNWLPGDIFVVEETNNGRLIIKKQLGVSKFILEGMVEKDEE